MKFKIMYARKDDLKKIPAGYGLAYYDFNLDTRVYYLFPINLFIWFWMNHLRWWLFRPKIRKELLEYKIKINQKESPDGL